MVRFYFFTLLQCCWHLAALAQFDPNAGTVSPQQFEAESAFEFRNQHIYVHAEVNGVKGIFILDNGFTVTGLDEAFAKRCGIKVIQNATLTLSDANETQQEGQYGTAAEINLAGVRFQNTQVALINTNSLPTCEKVDGFIGSSVINKANWQILFGEEKIKIASRPFVSNGLRCTYTTSKSNRHFIEFKLAGEPFWVHIDLGSSGELDLNKEAFTPYFQGVPAQLNLGVSGLGVFGPGKVDTFFSITRPFAFSYGPYRFPNSPRIELQNGVEYARLGLGYLGQFDLIINPGVPEYIFSPNKLLKPQREEAEYGVTFFPINGQYRVLRISSHANVRKYALKLDDVIEKIDGRNPAELGDWCTLREYVRNKASKNEPIQLKIQGKSDVCTLYPGMTEEISPIK